MRRLYENHGPSRRTARYILIGGAVLLAMMVVWPSEAVEPLIWDGRNMTTSPEGNALKRYHVGRVTGDITGDGKPEIIDAWNVVEFDGAGGTFNRPDRSGVFATYSEDIYDELGNVVAGAGEKPARPDPEGWVNNFGGTHWLEPFDIIAVIDDPGAPGGETAHVLSPPGDPIEHGVNLAGFSSPHIGWAPACGDATITVYGWTDLDLLWTSAPHPPASPECDSAYVDPSWQYKICGTNGDIWVEPEGLHSWKWAKVCTDCGCTGYREVNLP